ncbi:ribosomal RNA small subunit methyltransferase A, partial [Candidatus Berkelbacteria bacterium CG11_big_fil_rev_8_21_14_0_20_42_15]
MNKSQLIQFLRENEIWAKRTMGQNFLVKQKILPKIVAAAELTPTDTVV